MKVGGKVAGEGYNGLDHVWCADGLEKVTPFKNGNFGYLYILVFWGVDLGIAGRARFQQ